MDAQIQINVHHYIVLHREPALHVLQLHNVVILFVQVEIVLNALKTLSV